MFETIHHFTQLSTASGISTSFSTCVGDNSCGVYFNTAPSDTNGLFFGATHLQNSSATDTGVGKGFLADSDNGNGPTFSMTGSDQGMYTDGSAINNFWADTTAMDNLRGADITNSSIAGSIETIGANTAANNVRGGHSVHDASGEVVKKGWLNTQFNSCSTDATALDGCAAEDTGTLSGYGSTF
jgi:hypothetical protein